MKKIIVYILSSFIFATTSFAALDTKNETKVEIKKRLSANVIKKDNDDVVIKLPSLENLKKVESKYAPRVMVILLSYVYPDADFNKFDKIMSTIQESSKGKVSIDTVTETATEFLRSKQMFLRKVGYSQSSVIAMIDDGLPLYAYLRKDDSAFNAIAERTKKRPNKAAAMKDWAKTLNSQTQKKFANNKEAYSCVLMGFNKATKEYLVLSGNYGLSWVAESELKGSLISLYQLNY